MKLGLIGARGSGKSELAQALPQEFTIVDNYIDSFQERTNLATAQYGTYIVNMMIAMDRYMKELEAERDSSKIITCGTLVDTSIYLAYNAALLDAGVRSNGDLRSFATMQLFAMFKLDAWSYDHTFYLPLGERRDEEKDKLAATFDDHVAEACEAFNVTYTTLSGTLEEKVNEVSTTIAQTEQPLGSPASAG